MKLLKFLAVLVAIAGAVALAIVYAPVIEGQQHRSGDFSVFRFGAAIGASVRDLTSSDKTAEGVVVEDVRPGSPAEKGGLKRGDVVVEFDGEHVRSARQFTRLVRESPDDREVKVAVIREGKRTDLRITPADFPSDIEATVRDRLRDLDVEHLSDRLRDFNFDFDLAPTRGRLGVSVMELTPQLAGYFGVKTGVLIASVAEHSAAERAGLKAGDVITAVNGNTVASRADLTHALRDADGETTIGVTRGHKELTVKADVLGRSRTTRR